MVKRFTLVLSIFLSLSTYAQNDFVSVRSSEPEPGITPVMLSHLDGKTYIRYNQGPLKARFEYAYSYDSNLVSTKLDYVPQMECCPKEMHSPLWAKMQNLKDKNGIIRAIPGFKFPENSQVKAILGDNNNGFFLYTTVGKNFFYDGYGIVECDKDLNIIRKTEVKISEVTKAQEDKHPSKNGIPQLLPSQIVVRPDNSMILFTEENWIPAQGPEGTAGSLTMQQGFANIVCFFLDKNLKETSTCVIKKKHFDAQVNADIMSYSLYERGEYVYVFYNGSFKYDASEANSYLQVIGPDNKITAPILLENTQSANLLLNQSSYKRPIMKVSDDAVQILGIRGPAYGEEGNQFRLVEIKFLKPLGASIAPH